ncbi:hypothetical protein V8E52_010113, partial [Russula decolorans]
MPVVQFKGGSLVMSIMLSWNLLAFADSEDLSFFKFGWAPVSSITRNFVSPGYLYLLDCPTPSDPLLPTSTLTV